MKIPILGEWKNLDKLIKEHLPKGRFVWEKRVLEKVAVLEKEEKEM